MIGSTTDTNPGPITSRFTQAAKADVDRAHDAVAEIGGVVLDPPTEYGGQPGYGEQYYAVFFADPDGVKLEVCCVSAGNP